MNVKELIEENKILKKNINDITQIKRDLEKQLEKSKQKINLYEKVNNICFKYFIKSGKDINIDIDSYEGKSLLFYYCDIGNESIVRYLVELGADIHQENKYGFTPLFNACKSGNESLVKYLVKQGADIHKESNYGYIPLFEACKSGNET
ncbi:hypothetical protein PIROE2DRAFT_61776 [Piromyces sp. E2]|nr:hypothetical protein PIROE2DRAFT_61776 [Piromyces sp. E2]|eukprot:OUM62626.1 hypothetical protein PIROE2DRAFT_61776 [Piromyces sp. E2]